MSEHPRTWSPAWSLHAQWQTLGAGYEDPASLSDLWQDLIDYYGVVYEICPPPLLDRLNTILDDVIVPQTREEWDEFGCMLAQIDALIVQHGRVDWVADDA